MKLMTSKSWRKLKAWSCKKNKKIKILKLLRSRNLDRFIRLKDWLTKTKISPIENTETQTLTIYLQQVLSPYNFKQKRYLFMVENCLPS